MLVVLVVVVPVLGLGFIQSNLAFSGHNPPIRTLEFDWASRQSREACKLKLATPPPQEKQTTTILKTHAQLFLAPSVKLHSMAAASKAECSLLQKVKFRMNSKDARPHALAGDLASPLLPPTKPTTPLIIWYQLERNMD